MHWIWSIIAAIASPWVYVRRARSELVIYLTFDDGPHPQQTPLLLDMLKAHQAKASFFLLGKAAQEHPELVRRIAEEGHVLGNHSMTHQDPWKLTRAAQMAEIDEADAVLKRFDGQDKHLFRPPRGHASWTSIVKCALQRRYLALWNFDSHDYKLAAPELRQRLEQYQPRGGDILLFHDDMSANLEVLGAMLPKWRASGVSFAGL